MTSRVARLSSLLFCQEADIDAITNERDQVEEMIDLKAALARLTHWQRRVLALWAQGYSQEEIGEMENLPQPTISRVLTRIGGLCQ